MSLTESTLQKTRKDRLPSASPGNRSTIKHRLLLLRNAKLVGTVLVLLGCHLTIGSPDNLFVLITLVMLGAACSILDYYRLLKGAAASDADLLMHLLVDAVLVLALVWFTGRASNPFIYYLLVLVAISAAILSQPISWQFSFGSIFSYSALLYFDFNDHINHMTDDFRLHLVGMWINFVGSALLICFFVSKLSTALRDREILLAKAREDTLKNEQLIAVGTLAASTVHAIGTPLSTLAVLVGELKNDIAQDCSREEFALQTTSDLELMQTQIERCKSTMGKLSLLADKQDISDRIVAARDILIDLEEHYDLLSPSVAPAFSFSPEESVAEEKGEGTIKDLRENIATQKIVFNLLLHHALVNLIDNAIQAAETRVLVAGKIDGDQFLLSIEDDGPGFSADMLSDTGKPIRSSKEDGLGIGIFLANTTIERVGGAVRFYNRSQPGGIGATTVLVTLPLS